MNRNNFENKNEIVKKGDEDMAKDIKNVVRNKVDIRKVNEILNKGTKRYDKALRKLSKN